MNHYELKFDIKTNDKDMIHLLGAIARIVSKNLEPLKDEITVLPTVTDLTGTAHE